LAASAIQDGAESARRPHARLQRAAGVNRRVRARGANELSGGEDEDEDNGGLLQSSAHDSSWGRWNPGGSVGPSPDPAARARLAPWLEMRWASLKRHEKSVKSEGR
jgi:hypothetical protein